MFQINDINKFEALFLFEPGSQTPQEPRGYCFAGPAGILTLNKPSEANNFFKDMERLNKEHYLSGYFNYELGYIFEEKLKKRLFSSGPFAVFCAFKKRYVNDSSTRQKNEYTINLNNTAYRKKI